MSDVRSRADLVFGPSKVAVYVDGCFWHGCPEHGTMPKANAEFWRQKLEKNKARDATTVAKLRERGWTVVRIWEHECVVEAADLVEDLVRQRHPRRTED